MPRAARPLLRAASLQVCCGWAASAAPAVRSVRRGWRVPPSLSRALALAPDGDCARVAPRLGQLVAHALLQVGSPRACERHCRQSTPSCTHPMLCSVALACILITHFDKGLKGFDAETGNRATRPELLRLQKRGTKDTATQSLSSSRPDRKIKSEDTATPRGTRGLTAAAWQQKRW